MAFLLGWIIVAILLIASISLAITRRGGDDPPKPTAAPTREPAPPGSPTASPTPSGERRRREIIAKTSTISGAETIRDSTTPQHAATEWMIEEDPRQLEPTDPQFDQEWKNILNFVFDIDKDDDDDDESSSPLLAQKKRFIKSLTRQDVIDAFEFAPTVPKSHNVSLGNYDEIEQLLRGTRYYHMLH